ncbi:hypothetical protein [Sorangium cellulosum]|uniref:hypothetical protein n=1 Tax=Sorangium cellulosum TaxID=56 RepID=UPI001012A460|nr:hypothetical protein [Sorangium cellulosum]
MGRTQTIPSSSIRAGAPLAWATIMRAHPIVAAAWLSLLCALGVTSCIQSPGEESWSNIPIEIDAEIEDLPLVD